MTRSRGQVERSPSRMLATPRCSDDGIPFGSPKPPVCTVAVGLLGVAVAGLLAENVPMATIFEAGAAGITGILVSSFSSGAGRSGSDTFCSGIARICGVTTSAATVGLLSSIGLVSGDDSDRANAGGTTGCGL